MNRAELHPAYVWDCNQCGTENFERAITFEGSPQDLQYLKEEHGVQPWETGEFRTVPLTVTCSQCGTIYKTADDDEELE